jgi:4-carboxymuconolactone decarboxylase
VEKLRKVEKAGKPSRRDVMKSTVTLVIAALWGADTAFTQEKRMTDTKKSNALPSVLSYRDVRAVSPALEHYTKGPLLDGLWKRPELSPRDRSVVTVAALIARIQSIEMPFHWANAMSAVAVAKDIFHQRGIGVDQLPPAKEKLLPLNREAEKQRATQVSSNFGATSPGLVENTTNLLFLDLWLRPALAPRDRSLVTVSALIATAQVAQITYHLGRAMDNGLTQVQASEVLTHIAFYAGWPNAFSALPVVKDVFEKRQKQ